jgi:hypothetical protein
MSRTRSNRQAHVRQHKIPRVLFVELSLMHKVSRGRCRGEHVDLGQVWRLNLLHQRQERGRLGEDVAGRMHHGG